MIRPLRKRHLRHLLLLSILLPLGLIAALCARAPQFQAGDSTQSQPTLKPSEQQP